MSYLAADLFSNTPDYASLANKNEKQRQALIDLGQKQINAVFQGGTAPFYNRVGKGTAFDPSQTYTMFGDKGFNPYYDPKTGGHGFGPYGSGGSETGGYHFSSSDPDYVKDLLRGLFAGPAPSPETTFNTKAGNDLLYTSKDQTFQGFTPDFYNKRAQAYVDYAMPQLAKQYRDTRNTIGFGLANRGLRGSGTSQTQYSDLSRTNTGAIQGITDTGRSQAEGLRRQIEDERNTLINQLYQSADPGRGVQSAISAASNFAQPSTFAPLANTFSGLINQYYANQILNPRQGATSSPFFGGSSLNTGALPLNFSVG